MRERPLFRRYGYAASRITPARAGKTKLATEERAKVRDHPRSCGKDTLLTSGCVKEVGSPPLVRERLCGLFVALCALGITPARAGKTACVSIIACCMSDHPRSCGKDATPACDNTGYTGSPPLVRERLPSTVSIGGTMRITPARAGKTLLRF